MNLLKEKVSYKNRGMFLENLINLSNEYYINKDIAIIYKKPTPIKILDVCYGNTKSKIINKAVFEKPSTLDYNGIYKGKYIEFDAKECKNKTAFPLNNIKVHQVNHIEKIIKHGGIAFLIIFMNNKFYLLKGSTLLNFINKFERKSITYSFIEKNCYIIKEKFNPRLDYIEILDNIYFKEKKNEKNS